MTYYHIRVKYKSGADFFFSYEINFADTSVAEISSKYERGEDLFFDGRVISNRRIAEIKVFETEDLIKKTSDYLKSMYPGGYTFGGAREVTRFFIFSPPRLTIEEVPPLTVTREGVFFKGQQYDAYKRIRDILIKADESIVIIDGYVDESVLDMLESKNEGVEVKILTYPKSGRAIRAASDRFNRQYGNLQIRTSRDFHDRFVITDDRDIYHFGHSIKNLGDRGCMFSHIEEPMVIDLIRNEITRVWESARVIM